MLWLRPTPLICLGLLVAYPFSVPAEEQEKCFYPSKKDDGVFVFFDDCGSVDVRGRMTMNASHLSNIDFDSNNLACVVFSAKEAFYLHRDGKSMPVVWYDNSCDFFVKGLTRTPMDGRMAYMDINLELVLDPGFEFVAPFDYGHAMVCNGPFGEKKLGEHKLRTGGQCGLIDRQGKLVVEARHAIEDRRIFRDYINSNNHCPKPPITTAESAVCHAKRHVANSEYHSDDWERFSAMEEPQVWKVTFLARKASSEFTITVNKTNGAFAVLQRVEQD